MAIKYIGPTTAGGYFPAGYFPGGFFAEEYFVGAAGWGNENWKNDLKERVWPTDRIYIDFRQEIYPPYDSDLEYTLITHADNQPNGFNVTGGTSDYLLELPDTFTLSIRVKANFDYDTASSQYLIGWYVGATKYCYLYYSAAGDGYRFRWRDGVDDATLTGQTYTDNDVLHDWHDICVAIDLTTGDTSGSALYIDRDSKDTTWTSNIDAHVTNFPILEMRCVNDNEGDYQINHLRIFPNKVATSAEVAEDFKSVQDEEIIWHFNGEGCGRTRCNVTRFVQNIYNEKSIEDFASGSASSNTLTVQLKSPEGEFADDQYAAFDPTSDDFNGLVTQKYMQARCRLVMESWYNHDYEIVFNGRLTEGAFSRNSAAGLISTVTITGEDSVSDIARKFRRKAIAYEDKKISDTTEADSLIHLITQLATKDDIYNFLSNSSFENAVITNSWSLTDLGIGATWAKAAGGLFGSNEGQLTNGNNYCLVYQIVTFTGKKKLNVGETYTFSVWLKCADACGHLIQLNERDSGGSNDYTNENYSIDGGEGWISCSVTHTITDSDSDRLRCSVYVNDTVTLSIDGAMLIQNDRTINWFILNDNDGAAGVESADDADSDSYDTVGFDVDAVNVTHPYAVLKQGANIWDELKLLGDAAGAMYNGMDEAGIYKFRAKLKTGYADPTSLETITDDEITGVATSLEVAQANKIVVHGVKIKEYTNMTAVWIASASGSFDQGSGQQIAETIADGDYWPDEDDGDYWAKYGQI